MQRVEVNNKPLTDAQKKEIRDNKRLRGKFGRDGLQGVMRYIESLEKRIDALEKRMGEGTTPKPTNSTQPSNNKSDNDDS